MEIWLEKNGDRLRLPVTPLFSVPLTINNSKETLNEIGTVNIAGKPGLRTVALESFFPSQEYPFNEPGTNLDPWGYVRKIEYWARITEPIRLIITETPNNFEVLIDDFEPMVQDGSADVYYILNLSEYVRVETVVSDVKDEVVEVPKVQRFKTVEEIPEAVKTPSKYDTPGTMAKKLTGDSNNYKNVYTSKIESPAVRKIFTERTSNRPKPGQLQQDTLDIIREAMETMPGNRGKVATGRGSGGGVR